MEYIVLKHKYRWFSSLYLTCHEAQAMKKMVKSSSELQIFYNWAFGLLESTCAISY